MRANEPQEVGACLNRLAVDGDDHVVRPQLPDRGRVRYEGVDEHADVLRLDVVPEPAERDRGRYLLRSCHRPELALAPSLLVHARWEQLLLGDERRALVDAREEALEQRRLAHVDRDEVDAAAVARGLLALDLDERTDGPRPVREQEVVVRRKEEEARRDRDEDKA